MFTEAEWCGSEVGEPVHVNQQIVRSASNSAVRKRYVRLWCAFAFLVLPIGCVRSHDLRAESKMIIAEGMRLSEVIKTVVLAGGEPAFFRVSQERGMPAFEAVFVLEDLSCLEVAGVGPLGSETTALRELITMILVRGYPGGGFHSYTEWQREKRVNAYPAMLKVALK